eukprot:6302835-Prymnesium_polylepis.1
MDGAPVPASRRSSKLFSLQDAGARKKCRRLILVSAPPHSASSVIYVRNAIVGYTCSPTPSHYPVIDSMVHVLTLSTPTSEHEACERRSFNDQRYGHTPQGAGGSCE